MTHKRTAAALTAAAALALMVSDARVAPAADAGDLAGAYAGDLHHNTDGDLEDISLELDVQTVQPNGKFTGLLAEFMPITGKVTSTGKVTFSGQTTLMGQKVRVKAGKAQLSATGDYLVGSFTLVGVGGGLSAGGYTFAMGMAWE